ncbi:helix-turn-helix domain-containing protein [Chitinophaga arvensicola]|uniref:AraC-type DNA-binding protein n=1 Tax=Chitinophaga arvensicola TaxID=29529 RepID=A0A1I0S7N1_9BACT|nr:AraC family transcriptional regulator [Chitinophaga arvensicola]SEW51761.1 AraC-type DNA-binding protein [Chitinophaga arvensicola]
MESMTTSPCHFAPTVSTEQFIPEHMFIYLKAGSMTMYDGNKEYKIQSGDYCLVRRNYLAKYTKRPPENGKFSTVGVSLDQAFLRSISAEFPPAAKKETAVGNDALLKLPANPLFDVYVQTLGPYLEMRGREYDDILLLKKKELVLMLLKTHPELRPVLFDVNDPGKIDLEAFMNKHYKFNVSMKRFSYLTGRSLTTFKRDFEKIFHQAPGRWLLERRLREAHFMLEKRKMKPSDVYLELGFEDLSHFSYAFKKMYGITPNQLKKEGI